QNVSHTINEDERNEFTHQPDVKDKIPIYTNTMQIFDEFDKFSKMNAMQIAKKFPQLSLQDAFDLIAKFNKIDLDGNGALEQKEVVKALHAMGESTSYDEIRATLKEIDLSSTGNVEIEEFIELVVKLREGRNKSAFAANKRKTTVHGSIQNVSYTNEDERTEFTKYINQELINDPDVKDKIPIYTNTMQLFDEFDEFSKMNAMQIAKKFPQLSLQDTFDLVAKFNKIDLDGNGVLEQKEVVKALQAMGESISYDEIRATLKEIDLSSTGNVEIEEFIELVVKLREGRNKSAFAVNKQKITVHGSSQNVSHTINEDERTEFTRHINQELINDPDVKDKIPIDTDIMQIFDEDGLILAKLFNDSVPDTIDERVLNVPVKGKKVNKCKMTENNNSVIFSAKGIGCNVNIGSADLIVDIKLHPELYRLLEDDETLEQFLKLPPDQILLRWFNYHLKAAKWDRRVKNFSKDVSDGANYTILLNQLKPELCSRDPLNEPDLLERAEKYQHVCEKL
ncbi:6386_t:CDS:10, partial [Funneliformis geosporum]